jgi:putative DNA primase/helicase
VADRVPAFSEEAIALCAVQKHGADWLHAPDMGRWLHWTGCRFEFDEKRGIYTLARQVGREFAALAAKDKKTEALARGLATAHTRASVVSLMSEDPRLVVTSGDLDGDPMMMGTPNGVIDLRTGDLLAADRKYRITMSTAVAPAPRGTSHPLWTQFLETTFPKVPGEPEPDHELIEHVQRLAGYTLTAQTSEERFAHLLGIGRNGKGTLVETMLGIWADYAQVLPPEVLMERAVEPHRAELAVLRGKRLVVANEIPPGKRWNQARLMDMTGGGAITATANFMRGNPFTFKFLGKLWIVGNHKPAFPSANVAVRERLLLIRFLMKFLHEDEHADLRNDPAVGVRDNELKVRLRAEWPAILRWAIEGCLRWQVDGLRVPKTVLEDSREYLTDQDVLGQWVEECCTVDLTKLKSGEPLAQLFGSWNIWRQERQEKATSYSEFRDAVKERFTVSKAHFGLQAVGLSLTDFARAAVLRAKQEKEQQPGRRYQNGEAWDS